MPTPPRRRPVTPPARRPKVAGLRKPTRPDPAAETPKTPGLASPETTGPETVSAAPVPAPPAPAEAVAAEPTVPEPALPEPAPSRPVEPIEPAEPEADPEPEVDPEPVRGRDDALESDGDSVASAVTHTGVVGAESDGDHKSTVRDREVTRPAGKRRDAGTSTVRTSAAKSASTSVKAPRAGLNLAIGLAVAALVLAGLGLWFKGQGDRLAEGADRANAAFADPAATADVKARLSSGIERALSYDYTKLDATEQAVREVLSGKAVCEYEAMFGQVKAVAPEQRLVLTTVVRELGVRYLDDTRAEALVFIDQTSTRVDQGQTTASGAQLGVSAERVDGGWKITSFDTFDQPLPSGKTLPQC